MRSTLLLIVCFAATLPAWAADQSRSYQFTGVISKAECESLPQKSFEILPSLARSGSTDRLTVSCTPMEDETVLLKLTFLLTDAAPALTRGQSRRYSFRWGAKVVRDRALVMDGEFTRDEGKCRRLLELLRGKASQIDPNVAVTWAGDCYGDDHWGTSMEITLTETTR